MECFGEQYYSAQMCASESDLGTIYRFHDDGGFSFYRSQISASTIWPMAVLLNIEVPYKLRCQGLGTTALQDFTDTSRGKGACLAFLRVGWFGDLSDRDKTVSWYQKRGWQLLRIPPVPGLVVPFMYREL